MHWRGIGIGIGDLVLGLRAWSDLVMEWWL
jgi:hypothetical protein